MKPYSAEEIWKFLKEMVRVFSMMQQKNILHRDIKPANILIKKIG
jgi:serine/threonine protein kinase